MVCFLFLPEPSWAQATPLSNESNPGRAFHVGISMGHRIDRLDWSIPSGDGDPNVLSELTWNDLFITEVKGSANLILEVPSTFFSLYVRSTVGYGDIYRGDNQDSDYAGNNRTLEFSRSNNDAGDGNGFVVSVGWAFPVYINWVINASVDYQKWRTQSGTDTVFLSEAGIQDLFDETGILEADGIIKGPLNAVHWESSAVALGLLYRFQ